MRYQWIRWGLGFSLSVLPLSQASAAPFGMAGCGLGAALFKDRPGKVQLFVATTNQAISNQSSGITSGTSNCTDSLYNKSVATYFLEQNRKPLLSDIARGEGEALLGLASLYGCSDVKALSSTLREHFSELLNSDEDGWSLQTTVEAIMNRDSKLVHQCKQLA